MMSTGSLAFDEDGSLKSVFCEAITWKLPFSSCPVSVHDHAPEPSAVVVHFCPPSGSVAVTDAPG